MGKKVFTIVVFATLLFVGTDYYAAELSWQPASDSLEFNENSDITSLVESSSNKITGQDSLENSTNWHAWDQDSNYLALNQMGTGIIGEYIRFNNVKINDFDYSIDIKLTITDAIVANNKQEDQEYIAIEKNLNSLQTNGYTKIDFKIEFYETGTEHLKELSPMLSFSDIDWDQVIGVSSNSQLFLSTDTTLEYNADENRFNFTNGSESVTGNQSSQIVAGYINQSTIEFSIGVNRLDPNGSEFRVGSYIHLDIRFKKPTGQLEIYNVNEENEPLTGSKFAIYDKSGQKITTISPNNEGYAITSALPEGNYTLKQISAPNGYVIDNEIYSFSIIKDQQIVGLDAPITNKYMYGKVKINVEDSKNNSIEGVVYNVYNADDKLVSTITTNQDGMAETGDLRLGSYTIEQVSVPTDYIASNERRLIKLQTNNQVVSLSEQLEQNSLIDSADNSGVVIIYGPSGYQGTYKIIDENGTVIDTVTLDQDGIGTSKNLTYGNYCIEGNDLNYCFELSSKNPTQVYYVNEEVETDKNSLKTTTNKGTQDSNDEIEVGNNNKDSAQSTVNNLSKTGSLNKSVLIVSGILLIIAITVKTYIRSENYEN